MTMILNLILSTCRSFAAVLRRRNGQTLAEYGLIVAVIAVIVIIAAELLGTNLLGLFNSNSAHL
jgi:Flp pilus assembly pilin Flp